MPRRRFISNETRLLDKEIEQGNRLTVSTAYADAGRRPLMDPQHHFYVAVKEGKKDIALDVAALLPEAYCDDIVLPLKDVARQGWIDVARKIFEHPERVSRRMRKEMLSLAVYFEHRDVADIVAQYLSPDDAVHTAANARRQKSIDRGYRQEKNGTGGAGPFHLQGK